MSQRARPRRAVDDRTALAARVGALCCLLLLGAVALPFLVGDPTEVSVYYGVTPVGPPLIAVFAAVALVALLAGAAGRSDPQTVAGVSLVLAAVVAVVSVWWALAARAVIGGMTSVPPAFGYHPHAVVVLALTVVVATALFARGVLGS